MRVVRLSALRTGRLYPTGNTPGTHICKRLSRTNGHSAAGRIMSMKNSNETIGDRTRDLPACSAVPQPTVSPRAPKYPYGLRLLLTAYTYVPVNKIMLLREITFLHRITVYCR